MKPVHFGNLKRQFKGRSAIENPEYYLQVFRKFSLILHLGDPWKCNHNFEFDKDIFNKRLLLNNIFNNENKNIG